MMCTENIRHSKFYSFFPCVFRFFLTLRLYNFTVFFGESIFLVCRGTSPGFGTGER